jgi:hypothetical protein
VVLRSLNTGETWNDRNSPAPGRDVEPHELQREGDPLTDVQRTFTISEANALLPVLREHMLALQQKKAALDAARDALAQVTPEMRSNGGATEALRLEHEVHQLMVAIRDRMHEVESLGVHIKDLNIGLADFPSMRDGRLVYLCWNLSEPEVSYWHELDSGFRGRQPL